MDRLATVFTAQYEELWLGAGAFLWAFGCIYFGVAFMPLGGVRRSKNPIFFWVLVSVYFVAGAKCWIDFLHPPR